MRRLGQVVGTASVALLVIACGGGGAPAAATPSPSAASSAASSPAAGSAEPTAPASVQPSTAASSGGGSAAGVCDLVTTDELKQILGVPVTTNVLKGPPDTCDIQADNAPIAAFQLTRKDAATGLDPAFIFQAFASSPTATAISGIGDKASYSSDQQTLVVLKGDGFLSIAVSDDTKSADLKLEIMKQIGAKAASRM